MEMAERLVGRMMGGKTGKTQTKYIFNSLELVEEKFELKFTLYLSCGCVVAWRCLAQGTKWGEL